MYTHTIILSVCTIHTYIHSYTHYNTHIYNSTHIHIYRQILPRLQPDGIQHVSDPPDRLSLNFKDDVTAVYVYIRRVCIGVYIWCISTWDV